MNRPIFFALSNRGQDQSNVWIRFVNSGNSDPALASIEADGGINVYIVKNTTSTWFVVAQKSEGYDTIYVNDFSNNNGSGCTVSWINRQVSSVSGYTAATRLAGKRNSSDIDNAAKTATNYLKFDSSGLCVGNMTASSLGCNALITSSQYQIRNGSTVLSSFGASQITLGQNSASAKISFCDSQGSISYDANNRYLTLGASNTLRLSGGANALMSGRNVIVESTSGRLSLNSAQEVMANGYYVCNIVPLWGEGLSSGTITLSHGTEDYHAILIETAYSDYVLAGSHVVAMPAGKTVDLSAISAGSGWASLFRMRVTISGNKITPQSNGSFNVINNTWATGGANQLYIRYVLGFKRAI